MPKSFKQKKYSKGVIGKLIEGTKEPVEPDIDSYLINKLYIEDSCGGGKRSVLFDKSLERLKKEGYKRHLRPNEFFSLMINYYERTFEKNLDEIAEDILQSKSEWLSMAAERKGNNLICYSDPENIMWDMLEQVYFFNRPLEYNEKRILDIPPNDPHKPWIELKEFSDDFVKYFYTRKLKDLPDPMQKHQIKVFLPNEDGLAWPLVRGCSQGKFDLSFYLFYRSDSRGIRLKQSQ